MKAENHHSESRKTIFLIGVSNQQGSIQGNILPTQIKHRTKKQAYFVGLSKLLS